MSTMPPRRRSASPPAPPLSPSPPRATAPPRRLDHAGHTPPPPHPRGDSSALPREDPRVHLLLCMALLKTLADHEAMERNNIKTAGTRIEQTAKELIRQVYVRLPPRLQDKVYDVLQAKIKRRKRRRLFVIWILSNFVLLMVVCFLIFIIDLIRAGA